VIPIEEVLPGVFHWTAEHPRIHIEVSSYWLDDAGVLFDPLVPPEEGIEWFDERASRPRAILLSNRHHYRESNRFVERFGCSVHCNSTGMHEFTHGEAVEPFDIGAQLPGGVVAHELDAICPDDTALYLPDRGALVLADGVVKGGPYGGDGPLGFVPDSLMDDPPETKRGLLAACARLLDGLELEHLLLAHGGPVIGNGRALLADLVDCGGRTAFEM
jgi:glyoxylase-like metal-dependent hydrolase (beta-lactamase superfamily II)